MADQDPPRPGDSETAPAPNGDTEEVQRLRAEVARLSSELSSQQRLYIQVSEALARQEEDLRLWQRKGTVRIAVAIQRAAATVAPPRTARRRWLFAAAQAGAILRSDGGRGLVAAVRQGRLGRTAQADAEVREQYDEWRVLHDPDTERLKEMRRQDREWTYRPLVSVLVPTYESQVDWLRPALESVLGQVYENWELCIADDGSTDPRVRECLEQFVAADARVRVVYRPANGGIAAASATALDMAGGEYVALLDHDDLLAPHALHSMVAALQGDAVPEVVYSDEDLKLVDGRRVPGFFKPDFSPDLLLSVNYMCHLAMLRTDLVRAVGGFRPGFDGSQDHDLLLRATERATTVAHVADVLYTWRQVPGSVALQSDSKMYAYEAGRRAVTDALQRRGLAGEVTLGRQLGTYYVRLAITGSPRVAIVIPTRDRVHLLRQCIESIERLSSYAHYSITIVDNDSTLPETLRYLDEGSHRVVRVPGHFNYSKLINAGRRSVEADFLLTLNNDIVVRSPDWIEALLEQAQRPEVGVVGGRLLYPDGRTQHEGIGVGNLSDASTAINLDAGWLGGIIRDVSAVTGACQMSRLDVFDAVGGYDESLQVGYNDVDYCLRVRQLGYLVVYTPHAELMHHEGATRGPLSPAADERIFHDRWVRDGGLRDPYVSEHLLLLNPLRIRV